MAITGKGRNNLISFGFKRLRYGKSITNFLESKSTSGDADVTEQVIWNDWFFPLAPIAVNTDVGNILYSGLLPTATVTLNQVLNTFTGNGNYAGLPSNIVLTTIVSTNIGDAIYTGLTPNPVFVKIVYPQLGNGVYNGFIPTTDIVNANTVINLLVGSVVYQGFRPYSPNIIGTQGIFIGINHYTTPHEIFV